MFWLYNTGGILDVDQGKELLFYLSDAKSDVTATETISTQTAKQKIDTNTKKNNFILHI